MDVHESRRQDEAGDVLDVRVLGRKIGRDLLDRAVADQDVGLLATSGRHDRAALQEKSMVLVPHAWDRAYAPWARAARYTPHSVASGTTASTTSGSAAASAPPAGPHGHDVEGHVAFVADGARELARPADERRAQARADRGGRVGPDRGSVPGRHPRQGLRTLGQGERHQVDARRDGAAAHAPAAHAERGRQAGPGVEDEDGGRVRPAVQGASYSHHAVRAAVGRRVEAGRDGVSDHVHGAQRTDAVQRRRVDRDRRARALAPQGGEILAVFDAASVNAFAVAKARPLDGAVADIERQHGAQQPTGSGRRRARAGGSRGRARRRAGPSWRRGAAP